MRPAPSQDRTTERHRRRRALPWLLVAMVVGLLSPMPARAEPSSPAPAPRCEDITASRPDVRGLLASGRAAAAVAVLERAVAAQGWCPPGTGLPENAVESWYWLRSDLALAYVKAGREMDCLRLLATIESPYSLADVHRSFDEGAPVVEALDHNFGLCQAAHETRRGAFQATPCPIVVDSAVAAVAMPGRGSGCVALLRGADFGLGWAFGEDTAQASPEALCPKIAMLDAAGRRTPMTVAAAGSGPLADLSACCLIETISVAETGGRLLIRVQGGGHDCFNGATVLGSDAIYRQDGPVLVLTEDDGLFYH